MAVLCRLATVLSQSMSSPGLSISLVIHGIDLVAHRVPSHQPRLPPAVSGGALSHHARLREDAVATMVATSKPTKSTYESIPIGSAMAIGYRPISLPPGKVMESS